jgi:twitching motility two-component system response regulator PilH
MARILVADDSTAHIDLVSEILKKHQHEIIVANDGLQACQLAVSEQPNLIIMDVVMPNLNGFQATRKITHTPETNHIPIIMLTAKEQEADKVWALRQGAQGYVSKPPNEKELMELINSLISS